MVFILYFLLGSSGLIAQTLFTYSLVTKSDLSLDCGKISGKVLVGGSSQLKTVQLKASVNTGCPLEVEGLLRMTNSRVDSMTNISCARATKDFLNNSQVSPILYYPLNTPQITLEMESLSKDLLRLKNSPGRTKVKNLSPTDFTENQGLALETHGTEILVINISGEEVDLEKVEIHLKGNATPKNIIWNFFEAKKLNIKDCQISGIKGTVLAPQASLKLINSRIIGAVFVSKLDGTVEDGKCVENESNEITGVCFSAQSLLIGCK